MVILNGVSVGTVAENKVIEKLGHKTRYVNGVMFNMTVFGDIRETQMGIYKSYSAFYIPIEHSNVGYYYINAKPIDYVVKNNLKPAVVVKGVWEDCLNFNPLDRDLPPPSYLMFMDAYKIKYSYKKKIPQGWDDEAYVVHPNAFSPNDPYPND